MGYSKVKTPLGNLGTVTRQPGYCFKLCPYSTNYRDKYIYSGPYYIGFDADRDPVLGTDVVVLGNTTNQSLQGLAYDSYPCSEHTTTSGRMEQVSNPPGWICRDPNCYYTATLASGRCYRER